MTKEQIQAMLDGKRLQGERWECFFNPNEVAPFWIKILGAPDIKAISMDSGHWNLTSWQIIDAPKKEPQFKPFDKVLVRDNDGRCWQAEIFSHISTVTPSIRRYVCISSFYDQCIPYEGNEHLLGTTDKE